jgi:hypothetical protein
LARLGWYRRDIRAEQHQFAAGPLADGNVAEAFEINAKPARRRLRI